MLGFVLCALGAFSLVGLFLSGASSFTHSASFLLLQGFGWPGFLLPLAFLALGAWLILRQFHRSLEFVPVDRAVGIALLYLDLCLSLQFLAHPTSWVESLAVARQGHGGGLVGAALLQVLLSSVDWLGTLVILLAVFLAGLLLTLRVPLSVLFRGAYHLGEAGIRVLRSIHWAPTVTSSPRLGGGRVASSAVRRASGQRGSARRTRAEESAARSPRPGGRAESGGSASRAGKRDPVGGRAKA